MQLEMPTTMCRSCGAAFAEFPSIYCEGCLDEVEGADEAKECLAIDHEEMEEGFQVVTPKGIAMRSALNDVVPDPHHIVTLALIVVYPASALARL